jgi:hypothetical protein
MSPLLDETARAILRKNDRGGYTVPNGRVYPFQWNWDSAFVALGFDTFDRDRAWREIETLMMGQWDDGFVPHIIFWKDDDGYFPGPAVWATGKDPVTSGITQPPVAASVLKRLWQSACLAGEQEVYRDRAVSLARKLFDWHQWFARNRDFQGRGVVVAVHPWETGRDNSPEWDVPAAAVDSSRVGEYQRRDITHLDTRMRPTKADYDRFVALVQFGRGLHWDHSAIGATSPFRVADVGMTMILLRSNRDLRWLADELGLPAQAAVLASVVERTVDGVDYLWDGALKAWCSRDTLTGRFSGHVTSTSFLSFYAGLDEAAQSRHTIDHLERIASKSKYLVPSLDVEDPDFDLLRYWRGPVWSVVNYMIAQGLAEAGYAQWAGRVREDTLRLIEVSGFYEAFSPMDGTGSGGPDFSWTAAIWLALQQKGPADHGLVV